MSGFPKLTEKELQLNEIDFEKDADAVILNEEGLLVIGYGNYQLTTKRRIKILTEKGVDQANINLRHYSKNNIESISQVRGQSINLVNGIYVSSPIDSKEVFTVSDLRSETRFAIPNVKVGSIIEYEYKLTSNSVYLIDAWDFQHAIPTLYSKFKLDIQSTMDYTSLMIGKNLVNKYGKGKQIDLWELRNSPSYKTIKFAYNVENRAERIRLQLKGYQSENGYKSTISHWNDLKRELNENNSKYFSPVAVRKYAESIPNGKTELETMENVLNSIKASFKWSKYYGIYNGKSLKEVIESGIGNIAELNYILHFVLKEKNIKSDLVITSTREHGNLLTSFPYLQQFNYLVSVVKLKDGSSYLVNAANLSREDYRFAPLNLYNDFSFVLTEKEDKFVKFNQVLSKNEVEFNYDFKDGNLTEQRKDVIDGYFYIPDLESEKMISRYVTAPIAMPNDHKVNPIISSDKKYLIRSNYTVAFRSPSFLMIQNPLKAYLDDYTLNEENRIINLEFDFPQYFKIFVNVNIPDGYEVPVLNQFKGVVKDSEGLIYAQNAAIENGKLYLIYEFLLDQAVYNVTDYQKLKTFFQRVHSETQKEIVIKKKK